MAEPRQLPPAAAFRQGIQSDAEKYLADMLGAAQGKVAGARVALAFSSAARAARKPEALYECSQASIVACIAMSAITNLMPGGPNPTVYLVPKGGELQWWITHRGIAALALRAGYQILAVPVHKDDELDMAFGEVIGHTPDPDAWADTLDDLRGVYVTIRRLSDGVVLGRPWLPIVAIRKRAKKAQTQDVWREWAVEQAQKTAIKWAMSRGYIPADAPELAMAMESDAESREVIDVPLAEPQPTSARSSLGLDRVPQPQARAITETFDAEAAPAPTREPEPVVAPAPKATPKPKAKAAPEPVAPTMPPDAPFDDMP